MLRTRSQRQQATVEEGGWAELPDELVAKVLAKVLELLQAAGQSEPQAVLGFSRASATLRLVCAAWKAVHDALVKRLVLSKRTTDEAVGMLLRRFPAVVSLEIKREPGVFAMLTDKALRAVSSCTALASLSLSMCRELTDEGMRLVSNLPALTYLDLTACELVTDVGVGAVSSLPALTFLDLTACKLVTDVGVRAVSSLPALTFLDLTACELVTDVGVRAVSNCTALTSLSLWACPKVTDVGVRAVSNLHGLTLSTSAGAPS
jgi:hypothetical protein